MVTQQRAIALCNREMRPKRTSSIDSRSFQPVPKSQVMKAPVASRDTISRTQVTVQRAAQPALCVLDPPPFLRHPPSTPAANILLHTSPTNARHLPHSLGSLKPWLPPSIFISPLSYNAKLHNPPPSAPHRFMFCNLCTLRPNHHISLDFHFISFRRLPTPGGLVVPTRILTSSHRFRRQHRAHPAHMCSKRVQPITLLDSATMLPTDPQAWAHVGDIRGGGVAAGWLV